MKEKIIKISFVLLSVLVVAGTVGFGVYSYYYHKSDFASVSNEMMSGRFNPLISIDGSDGYFLGDTYYDLDYNCDFEEVEGWERYTAAEVGRRVTCESSFTIKNDGTTKINVNIGGIEIEEGSLEENRALYLKDTTFQTDVNDFTLDVNETQDVHVVFSIQPEYTPDVAIESYPEETDIYYNFSGKVKINATQVVE